MAVVATDIEIYASANNPENDTDPAGGAVLPTTVIRSIILSTPMVVRLVSTSASDTMSATVYGVNNANGQSASEAVTMTGTTQVVTTTTWSRITKVTFASALTGNVQIYETNGSTALLKRSTTNWPIPGGSTAMRTLFIGATSASGSPTTRYEKIVVYNTNVNDSLSNVTLTLTSDPQSDLRLGYKASDTSSSTNRITNPGGLTFYDDDAAISVAGGLGPDDGIGVWIEQTIAAGSASYVDLGRIRLSGTAV